MGTQGPGRKRIPNREKLTAEDDALNQIAREAEARLAAKRAARAEAREIRMKELERQQKEMSDDEERMSVGSRGSLRVEERTDRDRDFLDKGSRTASTLSAATLASLGGASSRRGSCDTSFSVETEASIRDMKESLAEWEEKYRKAMVSNAQLHNEKSTVMYQVETLREELSDMEELLWESRRHCDDTSKELERERHAHRVLQFQFKDMEDTLRQTEELLTKHGVVISPEVSTNGEAGQGEVEDDVSTDSASRLAQEPCPGGRESMLGKVPERHPAECGNLPQEDRKFICCQLYKHSQSLNVIPTDDRTEADALKQVTGFDEQAGDTPEKQPGRNKCTRKLPTTKAQLPVDDPTFKGRTEPVESNLDVPLMETERCFDDQICEILTNLERTQIIVHQSEGQAKCVGLVSPVRRAPTKKVHKSRPVPPRPAEDIILDPDNKAIGLSIVASGKLNPLTQEQQKHVVMGSETPSSDRDVAQKSSSAVSRVFQTQETDRGMWRDGSHSGGEVVSDLPALGTTEDRMNELSPPTPVDSLKENESVDMLAEIDGDGEECAGHSFEDEDPNVFTDLVENETVVSVGKTSQSLIHRYQTASGNLGSTRNEDEALKTEGCLSCCGVSEGPTSKTKLKPPKLDASPPAGEAVIGGKSGMPERIHEEEPVRESVEIRAKTQDDSSEHPERNDQREMPKTSAPFVSAEMLREWSSLEKKIQSMLKGFVETRAFSAEISRIFPDVPESLNRFILDFEETLKNATEDVSNQLDTTGQITGTEFTAEGELLLKDKPEGSQRGSVEQGPAGRPMIIRDCLVSSLEVHPQTYDVPVDQRKVCEEVQEPPAGDEEEATENTSGLTSSILKLQGEVTESSPEEMPGLNAVDVEEGGQSRSDPTPTSWLEDFVFVELYFAEPANMVESGQDQGKTNKQRGTVRRSQSCIVPAEDTVETRLKRHRALSSNSQSSKVRRLIEMTADEFKAMAVPELALRSAREGRIYDESTRSNSEDQDELSVGDIDSCEEVYEEAAQQPATQQRHPVREVVVEDGKIAPGARSGRKGFSLDNRKYKHKTDCKIS